MKTAKTCIPKLWQQRSNYVNRQPIKTAKTCTPNRYALSEVRVVFRADPEFWLFLGSGATEFWTEITETRITFQFPNLTPLAKKSAK